MRMLIPANRTPSNIAAPSRNIPETNGQVEQMFRSTQPTADRVHPVNLTRHTPLHYMVERLVHGGAAGSGVGARDVGAGTLSDGTDSGLNLFVEILMANRLHLIDQVSGEG